MPSMLRLALPMALTLPHSVSLSYGRLALQHKRFSPDSVSDMSPTHVSGHGRLISGCTIRCLSPSCVVLLSSKFVVSHQT